MRIIGWALFAVLAAFAFLYAYGCLVLSAPAWKGPVTDHFDGERFHNVPKIEHRGFGEFLKWRFTREVSPWKVREMAPGSPPPERAAEGQVRATPVGHATVLIQMDGLNILTDPVWSERVGPFPWLGPKRYQAPGIRFEDLPPIDVLLITHNHYDHMDLPTIRRLVDRFKPRIYTTLGNAAFLESRGIAVEGELDWWDEAELAGGVKLTAVPARHFSARGLCDRDRTLWASFHIAGPAGSVLFAGDTGFGSHFEEVRSRLGAPRLAILPIGSYKPEWFMSAVHVSPREAVEAMRILGAEAAIPIHYNTFALGDDAQDEASRELTNALADAGVEPGRFQALPPGEFIELSPPAACRACETKTDVNSDGGRP